MTKLKFKRSFFAAPYGALSLVFVIVPLVFIMIYAFTDRNGGGFTFDNFSRFADIGFWRTMGRSFAMAFLTTAICLLLAYPLALALCRIRTNRTAVLIMLFVLPMWINSLLRLYAIKVIFQDVIPTGFWFVLIGMVYDFFPFMLLPIYNILSEMDASFAEASGDLGASPLGSFLRVKLPLSVPGIVSGVLMVFMPTISSFAASKVLGDVGSYMFGNLIENKFIDSLDWNGGSAYSFVLLIMIILTLLLSKAITGGKAKASSGGSIL